MLARIVQHAVRVAVQEVREQIRTPRTLAGTVEQLDEDKDVAWLRMDGEAMTGDPTLSSNYGEPGVIPATRIGELYTGDQSRVSFDASAGATAFRTSGENVIVLPYGAETGRRIILDGNNGVIAFFNEDDQLVGLLDTDVWAVGNVDPPGARATLDPVGGLRIRSANDSLVAILDQQGYTLRDATTGLVTAEIKPGSFRMVDPLGTDDIEMVTSSSGTLPNPVWRAAKEINPGASLTAPAAPLFTTTPPDDIEIAHVAAWIRATNQAASATAPAGHTLRHNGNFPSANGTLETAVASRDPATGLTGDFTSSQSNWQHAIGQRVVIKGGGAVSPSYLSTATSSVETTEGTVVSSVPKPAGLAVGDVLLAFVSLGTNGGFVPTGWVTPPGFVQLGADFSDSGSGTTQSTLSAGCWAKLATAADVAATEFTTTINLPTGIKQIHAAMVAVRGPFLVPGGVQVRLAGKPIRRLLASTELLVASQTLCDITNISQAYDNLELVWDATSGGGNATGRPGFQFNGDDGTAPVGSRYYTVSVDNALIDRNEASTLHRPTQLSSIAGSKCSGSIHIYGYRSSSKPVIIAHAWWAHGAIVHHVTASGQWDGHAGVSAINRIRMFVAGVTTTFAPGSRVYLYGY